jgi:hypothetical protein
VFYDEVNEHLKNTIPGYTVILDGHEFNQKGSARVGKFGYRYLVNLGYRF